MKNILEALKGKLVVSCQALENEPLHSPFIMARMALAAAQGGAAAIRANSVADIEAIKQQVSLPVIGIIKRDYPDSEVFITATLKEVDELMTVQPDIIALDATARPRPGKQSLAALVTEIRTRYPALTLMADIATVDDAVTAQKLGFDCVGTTLYGYTAETAGHTLPDNNCAFLQAVLAAVSIPVLRKVMSSPRRVQPHVFSWARTWSWWAAPLRVRNRSPSGLWRQSPRKAPMAHDPC